jgi:hypothetical protein
MLTTWQSEILKVKYRVKTRKWVMTVPCIWEDRIVNTSVNVRLYYKNKYIYLKHIHAVDSLILKIYTEYNQYRCIHMQ